MGERELVPTPLYELVISEEEASRWLELLERSPHFWLFTLTQILSRPTPKEYVQKREGPRKIMLTYVEGSYAIATLAALSRLGIMSSFEVLQTDVSQDSVECLGKLTLSFYVDGAWVSCSKMQWGGCLRQAGVPLGSTKKGAATDAQKKCLSQFGWALDVYTTEAEWAPPPSKEEMRDSQIDSFYTRAREKGMTKAEAVEWCKEQVGKEPEEAEVKDLAALKRKLARL